MAITTGTAILIASGVAAAGSIYAAKAGSSAAKKAARVEAAAAKDAAGRLTPFTESGVDALEMQRDLLGLNGPEAAEAALAGVEGSPGFQFRRDAGVDALDRSAAAAGNLFGGNQARALTEFGQNFASNEFSKRLEQLGVLAGRGQSAAAGEGAAGIAAGMATASGVINSTNAIAGGIQGVGNAVSGGIEAAISERRRNELLALLA